MNQKKSFLILTSDSGFGHRQSALAVAKALRLKYGDQCDTHIVNPIFEQRAPSVLQAAELNYNRSVLDFPDFYRFTYDISDSRQASAIVENTLKLALFRNIEKLIKELKPDAILNTNQMFNAPAGAAISKHYRPIPLFTVVTDLADVHSMWFNNSPDRFFVASELVKEKALSCGIHESKITISGIPVDPGYATEENPRAELCATLGLETDKFTILFIGSSRVAGIFEHLEALETIDASFQVAVITGGNDRLFEQISQRIWTFPISVQNFVQNIPQWMKCADVLVTKAGGLILSEGLAAGLPILLIDYLPGQEEGNVRFILENRAGLQTTHPQEFHDLLNTWLQENPNLVANFAENSKRLGKPSSALFVADSLWNASIKTLPNSESHQHVLRRI